MSDYAVTAVILSKHNNRLSCLERDILEVDANFTFLNHIQLFNRGVYKSKQ